MTRLFLLTSVCLLASCQTLKNLTSHKPKKDDDKKDVGHLMVGTIDLVNPEQHFVLIRTIAHLMLPAGTELISTNSQGQTTKLKVTPEHKGTYLAADIVSGSPQSQDTVMYQPTSTAPPALNGQRPVRGGVTDLPIQPLPAPAPYQPPTGEPASSEFLRPIPPQPPLPTQPPQ